MLTKILESQSGPRTRRKPLANDEDDVALIMSGVDSIAVSAFVVILFGWVWQILKHGGAFRKSAWTFLKWDAIANDFGDDSGFEICWLWYIGYFLQEKVASLQWANTRLYSGTWFVWCTHSSQRGQHRRQNKILTHCLSLLGFYPLQSHNNHRVPSAWVF